jgi:hypothetical protein
LFYIPPPPGLGGSNPAGGLACLAGKPKTAIWAIALDPLPFATCKKQIKSMSSESLSRQAYLKSGLAGLSSPNHCSTYDVGQQHQW